MTTIMGVRDGTFVDKMCELRHTKEYQEVIMNEVIREVERFVSENGYKPVALLVFSSVYEVLLMNPTLSYSEGTDSDGVSEIMGIPVHISPEGVSRPIITVGKTMDDFMKLRRK